MDNYIIDKDMTINIDEEEEYGFCFEVEANATLLVVVSGHKALKLTMKGTIKPNVQFALLFLNHNQAQVEINDVYTLTGDAQADIAYCQLNNQVTLTDSNYDLVAENAKVKVLSVSLNVTANNFKQRCHHLANNTYSDIDNFGIVLKDGRCVMVVESTIDKPMRGCKAHQTSRLITYDSQSYGKILPILNIYDNEVEASHACSMGMANQDQLYYLQSRGLTHKEALRLISIGYLMPITKVIPNASINNIIKSEIETKVNEYV